MTNSCSSRAPLPLLLLCLAAPAAGAAQTGIANAGFEDGPEGGAPSGWIVPATGYTAAVVSGPVHEGARAVRVFRDSEPGPGQFGNVMRTVDAAPYRGKRVRLRGWVRVEPASPTGAAALWLRVDLPERRMGFFDNMSDRPIRDARWQAYEVVGDVAADAQSVAFGMLLQGRGSAWLDEVSLEVVAPAHAAVPEPPRPLSARALENLTAFARLLGYVRYFHPSDEAAAVDWQAFAVDGVRAVEAAPDAAALADTLARRFRSIAPGVAVAASRVTPHPVDRHGATAVVAWRHVGLGTGNPASGYRSTRLRHPANVAIPDSLPDPAAPLIVALGGGVSAAIPLAVYADAQATLPRGNLDALRPAIPLPTRGAYSGDDRATRLAAVALLWNVFQHFYPYFDVVAVDWRAELPRALAAAAVDADARAFEATLNRLVAALQDGHGSVAYASGEALRLAPVLWEWIEEQVVITAVAPGTEGVRPGDVVLRIGARPAAEVLAEEEALISSATPRWRRYRALRKLLTGPGGSELPIEVKGADGTVRSPVLRRVATSAPAETRPQPVAEVKPGIWYVDIDRVTTAEFQAALPQLAAASGLLFDLRGYPNRVNAAIILQHLLSAPGTSAQWHVPVITRPDRASLRFQRAGEWDLQPLQPHLAAARVFLTDGRAISYAESVLGIVEHYRLAEIVGGATAGTNGNVNAITLPGDYTVRWTGMKVLKHDGSQHHGVGIRPTTPATRTIAGVAAGRDELLERGIEVLQRKGTQ